MFKVAARLRRSPQAPPLALAAVLLLTIPALALAHAGGASKARQQLSGELVLLHTDDQAHDHAGSSYLLRTDQGDVKLKTPRLGRPWRHAGKRVTVEGFLQDDGFAVTGTSPSGSEAGSSVSGTRDVLVILMNFTNDTRQPWSHQTVAGVVFGGSGSANAYYQEVSYGSLALVGDVVGWFTIPYDNSGCLAWDWANAADAAAAAAGTDVSAYDNVVYAFPRASSCSFSGAASVNGPRSWINGSMTVRTVAHELGHNFGVHHASTLNCTENGARVTLSASCTFTEYGDPFSIMGSSGNTRHHNHWHRGHIGWLPEIVTITGAGTYDLAAAEFTTAPRLIRVPRGDGNYFYLELRKPFGAYDAFGSGDPVVNGVSIRLAPDVGTFARSLLLDTTPSTTSFGDAALGVGRTFADGVSGVSITTLSVSTSGARVQVSFDSDPPPPADTQAPTAPGSFGASPTGFTTVALAWAASTDNVGVAGYRVYRDGVLLGTTTATSYGDSGLASGTTYGYSVVAFDAAGNVSAAATASATTPAAPTDTTAPSAPTDLAAGLGKGKKVLLSWSASTDDVGVAGYRVYRDGALVAAVGTTSATDNVPGKVASATYTVTAVDAAGNESAASGAVTIRLR